MGASPSRKRSELNLSTADSCTASTSEQVVCGSCGTLTTKPLTSLTCSTGVCIDPNTYRHLSQDVTVVKTLLCRLKRLLQESEPAFSSAETLPAKNGYVKLSVDELAPDDSTYAEFSKDDLHEENSALRTQVALLRQEVEQKNWLIATQTLRLEHLERLAVSHRPSGEEFVTKQNYLPDLLPSSDAHALE